MPSAGEYNTPRHGHWLTGATKYVVEGPNAETDLEKDGSQHVLLAWRCLLRQTIPLVPRTGLGSNELRRVPAWQQTANVNDPVCCHAMHIMDVSADLMAVFPSPICVQRRSRQDFQSLVPSGIDPKWSTSAPLDAIGGLQSIGMALGRYMLVLSSHGRSSCTQESRGSSPIAIYRILRCGISPSRLQLPAFSMSTSSRSCSPTPRMAISCVRLSSGS